MKGYVYAMKNPALPGLLKIGRTQKDPLVRAAQLSNSSLPYCYEVCRVLSIRQADWGEDGESVIISRLRRKPEPWMADQEGAS